MSIAEKFEEFSRRREFCSRCGSRNYEIDYSKGKTYYLNTQRLICNSCKIEHTYDQRISLNKWRSTMIEKIIERK